MSPLREARDIEEERHIAAAINRVRKRTVIQSIVAAGLISLFIGHAFEVEAANNQATRSRKNCEFLNDRLKVSAARDAAQADQTLGNPNHRDKNGNLDPIAPLKIKGTAFEKFGPLIIAQAKQQRADAASTFKGIKDCNEVFPKQKKFFFVG